MFSQFIVSVFAPVVVGVLRLHLVLRNMSCIPLSLVIILLRCLWMLYLIRQAFCYTVDAVFVGALIMWWNFVYYIILYE